MFKFKKCLKHNAHGWVHYLCQSCVLVNFCETQKSFRKFIILQEPPKKILEVRFHSLLALFQLHYTHQSAQTVVGECSTLLVVILLSIACLVVNLCSPFTYASHLCLLFLSMTFGDLRPSSIISFCAFLLTGRLWRGTTSPQNTIRCSTTIL